MQKNANKSGYRQRVGVSTLLSGLFLIVPLSLGAQSSIPVKAMRLADIAIYPGKFAPATVVSLNNTAVSTQVGARIDEISVRVADIAEPGSILARLDCRDFELARKQVEAKIASLKARIELAQRRLTRTETLVDKQTVSEELLDEREADLAVLQADYQGTLSQLDKSRLDISRCMIVSPYKAVITARTGSVGEFAQKGTKLFEIVDIGQLEISAQVPATDIEQVITVKDLYFEDSTGRYDVELRALAPTVNTQTRNREARLLFTDAAALPGAAGKLIWQDNRPHISARLLVRRQDSLGVFIVDKGKARFHALPGANQGRAAPTALPADTRVVTEGQYGLQDGEAVKVIR
ncbi:MAG: efflux RND transporter periplasmic adaptor subunit [Gammaproteobacteria bacterium]|nr:efflux RND transporter periplasmic adaptor subunit [Gammaproteobacteria bacterium]